MEATEPLFWLTGKLFCGECKESMQGVSGTSKSGRIHYYYICKNHRKHKCKLRPVRKEFIEYCVIEILREFLSDQGNLASLAVDVSEYAKKMHSDDTYLKSLQAELAQAKKEIKNIVDAIKQGLVSKALQESLTELETKQDALSDAIDTEKAKLALANNDYGIKHYFEMYAKADFEDDETRRLIFEYFVDKIYVFDDKLIIDMFYSDNHVEVGLDAFLASEEYAKESIKDMGVVFDQNEDRSTFKGDAENIGIPFFAFLGQWTQSLLFTKFSHLLFLKNFFESPKMI
ncbi:MAG: recombinase zinc beta ribbon domain-containing protein [Lachnospiraceae bacterium]|nr:recombinase zinc beta ribbon domain-containing protein [Lachnospiraceae bacterium]